MDHAGPEETHSLVGMLQFSAHFPGKVGFSGSIKKASHNRESLTNKIPE